MLDTSTYEKTCSKCGICKNLTEFYEDSRGYLGYYSKCKQCHLLYSKTDKSKINRKKYKDRVRSNPDFVKKERDSSRERMRQYLSNPVSKERLNQNHKKYTYKRIKVDLNFKIRRNLRTRLCGVLRKKTKNGSAVLDLGCDINYFIKYIESKFYNNPITNIPMSWENWGVGSGCWNLDHIEELSSFDLTIRDNLIKACNYKNIQPLWFEDHKIKTSKYNTRTKEKNYATLF